MRPRIPNTETGFAALRETYDQAFQNFARKAHTFQSLINQPVADEKAVEEARRLVDEAHSAYVESRELLAQYLLSSGGGGAEPRHATLEALAYHFWEQAGRPVGKAEEHWHLAEQLCRSRQAAKQAHA